MREKPPTGSVWYERLKRLEFSSGEKLGRITDFVVGMPMSRA